MRVAIYAYTGRGRKLKESLRERLLKEGAEVPELDPEEAFQSCDALIFIGATGIAVRKVAPLLRDKFTDPAVLSLDEGGRYCISLLSGHVGGANRLAERIAALTGALPVISTATDLNGCFAVDSFARENRLFFGDRRLAKEVSAALLRGEEVGFSCEEEIGGALPRGLVRAAPPARGDGAGREPGELDAAERSPGAQKPEEPEQCRGGQKPEEPERRPGSGGRERLQIHVAGAFSAQSPRPAPGVRLLTLYPRPYCLGVGCRRGAEPEALRSACLRFLEEHGVRPEEVGVLASISLKKDERAILELKRELRAEFRTFSAERLRAVPGSFAASEFVRGVTGVDNVCERAAAAVYPELIARKERVGGATFALSRGARRLSFSAVLPKAAGMVLITGGAFQGKRRFAERLLREGYLENAVSPDLPEELLSRLTESLLREGELASEPLFSEAARELAGEHARGALIVPLVGNGLIPSDRRSRARREAIGRLSCLLAERAGEVWKLECGIPRRLR